MLGEETLSECDLESFDINSYYLDNKGKHNCCPCPPRTLCLCNTPSLRPYCCYCLGSLFYISSCVLSFYMGKADGDYDKSHHCNTTL